MVIDMVQKAKAGTRSLFPSGENELENLRLKTSEYEMIVSQMGNFTFIVTQSFKEQPSEEGEEGEAPAAE